MGNYNFRSDLKEAKETEKLVAQMLLDKQPEVECSVTFNNDNRWDFQLGNETYEVKDDQYSAKSGNVAIETSCRGKPSGISVTEADWWVHVIYLPTNNEQLATFTPTSVVKEMITKDYATLKTGGDKGSSTEFYTFPMGYLIEVSNFIIKGN